MRTLLACLFAAALTLTACGAEGSDDDPGSVAIPTETRETADLTFDGTTLDGESFDGESLAGRPAVLWFWAPWCPTCMSQIPNVTALAEQYDGEVAVVAVGGLDNQKAIRSRAQDIEAVTHLVDDEGTIWQHFGVAEQSTYTVIDADGRIVSEGFLDDDALTALVAELADGE